MADFLIFAGPTLSGIELPPMPGARLLPPACHGDLLRAILPRPPRALLLIDGYFRTRPAVRHKELLWALAQGVHVFGAASMGALRAVELAAFGMVGVGDVFEAFRSGTIEDDDEVAIEHGPAELDYCPLSDAMVDIRATFAAALREGIIGVATHRILIAVTKMAFYPERCYDRLLKRVTGFGAVAAEVEALRRWLPCNRVAQKRNDALAAVALVDSFLASRPPPFRPDFLFESTDIWEEHFAHARYSFDNQLGQT